MIKALVHTIQSARCLTGALLWSTACLMLALPAFQPVFAKPDWSRYLKPVPGTPLKVSDREARDLLKPEGAAAVRGWITVTPPAKSKSSRSANDSGCLTIEKSPDLPDERICKPSKLSFQLKDLDKNGFLKWKIALPGQVDRTPIQWPTPYRIAQTLRYDQDPSDPPNYFFIERCEQAPLVIGEQKQRRLKLKIFGGKTWTVYLPDKDAALPKLPEQDQFGYVAPGSDSSSGSDETHNIVLVDPSIDPNLNQRRVDNPSSDDASPGSAKHPNEDHLSFREVWHIPQNSAFEMPSSNFLPNGSSLPPGGKGKCRYTYQGPKEDPTTGRLECHNADQYSFAYMSLTCLNPMPKATN